jgi:hypothetical protein
MKKDNTGGPCSTYRANKKLVQNYSSKITSDGRLMSLEGQENSTRLNTKYQTNQKIRFFRDIQGIYGH